MKKLPLVMVSMALLGANGAYAQNVWNGAGVTGGTSDTDWTASANYGSAPTFSSGTDLKFSTITGAASGVTLSAGTGGTYAVNNLYFGDVSTLGNGQTTAQVITLAGNGTAGATTINLSGYIYVPSVSGSKVILGSDLTLNLTDAAHQVNFKENDNVTAVPATTPVLVINALVTGGGNNTTLTPRYSQYGNSGSFAGSAAMVLTNDNNSFVAVQNRFDYQVGFTSIANVGGGNSSMGNATSIATGTINLGNGGFLNFLGSGSQSTDRVINLTSTNTFGNAAAGSTMTYNGAFNALNAAVSLRMNVITGATLAINSVISDYASGGSTSISKQGASSYFSVTGDLATNDGGGLLVLGGNNTFSGNVAVGAGTLRIDQANALGNTVGTTTVSSGATLDINGQSGVGETISALTGTGVGNNGALINSNASTGATLTGNVALGLGNNATGASIGGTGNIKITGVISENLMTNGNAASRSLTKVGAGQLTLNGVNTYTGTTTVSAGSLGGIGSISTGAATFATGTTLNPGDGTTVGQFSFGGNLTLSNDAILSVSLDQAAGNAYDRVAVAGVTTITGAILNVNLGSDFSAGATTGQIFNILTSTGALTGQFDQGGSISATSGIYTYDFGISYIGNTVTLTLNNISAIPEASTYALIAGACALGLAAVRRRRRI